jgi:hypothetical protein
VAAVGVLSFVGDSVVYVAGVLFVDVSVDSSAFGELVELDPVVVLVAEVSLGVDVSLAAVVELL